MTIKVKIEIEAPNADDAQTQIEYIAMQVGRGYMLGEGYEVDGAEEESEDE